MMRKGQKAKQYQKAVEKRVNKRTCGDCVACCIVLGVAPLNKPRHRSCEYLSVPNVEEPNATRGCKIYNEKPSICSDFKCAWLASGPGFTGEMRPDRIGIVAWMETTAVGQTICLDELWAGAFDQPKVKALLRELGATAPLLLFGRGDLRRLIIRNKEMKVVHDSTVFGGSDAREESNDVSDSSDPAFDPTQLEAR